jgi:hypothetical protein
MFVCIFSSIVHAHVCYCLECLMSRVQLLLFFATENSITPPAASAVTCCLIEFNSTGRFCCTLPLHKWLYLLLTMLVKLFSNPQERATPQDGSGYLQGFYVFPDVSWNSALAFSEQYTEFEKISEHTHNPIHIITILTTSAGTGLLQIINSSENSTTLPAASAVTCCQILLLPRLCTGPRLRSTAVTKAD